MTIQGLSIDDAGQGSGFVFLCSVLQRFLEQDAADKKPEEL
jgi:hypothetical protein